MHLHGRGGYSWPMHYVGLCISVAGYWEVIFKQCFMQVYAFIGRWALGGYIQSMLYAGLGICMLLGTGFLLLIDALRGFMHLSVAGR